MWKNYGNIKFPMGRSTLGLSPALTQSLPASRCNLSSRATGRRSTTLGAYGDSAFGREAGYVQIFLGYK